jgi:hypothetical protein
MSTTRSFVKIGSVTAIGILGACASAGVALACNVGDGSNSSFPAVAAVSTGNTVSAVGATALSAPQLLALALAQRLEHGERALATSAGSAVVDVQAGTVTAADPTSVTVKSADGFTATYVLAASTKIDAAFGGRTWSGRDGSDGAKTVAAATAGDRVDLVALKSTGVVQVMQDLSAKIAAPGHSSDVRRWGFGSGNQSGRGR